jgi:hypothetical protein
MKKAMLVLLSILIIAGLAAAQTYTEGKGLVGIDKLGAHQNGGRGCVGCHAPHSGARGNGGTTTAITDSTTGDETLWGQDMGPLYGKVIATGNTGSYDVTLPANSTADEAQTTGIMMCLSCHDGNVAKGAMMTNKAYEQSAGLLPPGYGPQPIPTLLGNDGTAAGNYKNDHPIGPKATMQAVGVASRLQLTVCGTTACLQPKTTDTAYMAFYNHYGAFNVSMKDSNNGFYSGGRAQPVVIPSGATTPNTAYVVCTTCHTPHSMYTFSGNVRNQDADPATTGIQSGTYPTYFFIAAPYNPGAPIPDGTKASSATQFCRQCHFTGAGGSNEGSGIMTVDTSF